MFDAQNPSQSKLSTNGKVYAFYSDVSSKSGDGREGYNFYAEGDAPNLYKGSIYIDDYAINEGYQFLSTLSLRTVAGTNSRDGSKIEISSNYSSSFTTTACAILFTRPTSDVDSTPLEQGAVEIIRNNERGIRVKLGVDGSSTNTLDYRIKQNVATLENASAIINNLRPVTFDTTYKTGYIGFIAHELQEYVPQAVTGVKDETEPVGTIADYDGTELETNVTEPQDLTYEEQVEATPYVAAVAATYDEDGNELTAEVPEVEPTYTTVTRTKTWTPTGTQPVYQGVDQTKLIPLLTKALQEALDKIETLETRLTDAGIA